MKIIKTIGSFFLCLIIALVFVLAKTNTKTDTVQAQATTFRYAVWADTKGGLSILSTISKQVASFNPKFTVYPGDLCTSGPDTGCLDTWKNSLNGGGTNGMYDITFESRGNHDSSGTSVWDSYFNMSGIAANPRVGATNFT